MNKKNKLSFDDILKTYVNLGSVRATAKDCHLSEYTIIKVLVTIDAYDNPLVGQVASLQNDGLTTAEIAKKLHASISTVNKYTPYSKGAYFIPSDTANARRIRKCREGKKGENRQ